MRALILALALAACSTGAPEEPPPPQLPQRAGVDPLLAARAEGIEFRAVGDGFVLDIYRQGRIRLTRTASGEELFFPKPAPLYPRWRGSIYEVENERHQLRVEIREYRPCERPDSALFPTSVIVVLDGEEMPACGRAL